MAVTVLQLITNAYFESGLISANFQTPNAAQITRGLDYFNQVLGKTRIQGGMLPYYKSYDFTLSSGVEKTFIPNLVECETLVYYLGQVRMPIYPMSRRKYFGTIKPVNATSVPSYFNLERTKGGSNIFVTFTPQQEYAATLWGLFCLEDATLTTDLSEIYDQYYIDYLRYDLGVTLCAAFNQPVPEGLFAQYSQYRKSILNRSGPLDLTNTSISSVSKSPVLNWSQLDIGGGYFPFASYGR